MRRKIHRGKVRESQQSRTRFEKEETLLFDYVCQHGGCWVMAWSVSLDRALEGYSGSSWPWFDGSFAEKGGRRANITTEEEEKEILFASLGERDDRRTD